MPRITPQDLVAPELTQVQAAPVSTLTAPGITPPPATNSFLQLAGALQSVQPSLNRFLDNRMAEVTTKDIQKGQEAQLKNKMAFKDAVKNGTVPPGANPWFVQGYQEQEQRLNGLTFDQSLRAAWASSPVRNSDDPMAFKSWMQSYTSDYVEKNKLSGSPMFSVFQQAASGAQHNLASEHIAYRQQDIEQKTVLGAQTLINNVLDYPMIYNGGPGQIDAVKSIVNAHVANGMNPTIANRLVVDSITEKAKASLSISDLGMINDINFGNGSLGKTQYAREQIDLAERQIAERAHTKASSDRLMEKHNAEMKMDDLGLRAMDSLIKDPSTSMQPFILEAIKARVPPDEIKKLYGFRESALTDQKSIYEDPASTGDMMWKSLNGQTTPTEIHGALASKQITFATAAKMQENLKDTRNSILRDPMVNQQIEGVYRQYVAGDTTDPATIAKGNAIRTALSADAVKMAADNKSPWEISTSLIKKANEYQTLANFNDKTNTSVDPIDKGSRKAITALEGQTKKAIGKEAPKAPAPVAPEPAKEVPGSIKGYTPDEIQTFYKAFKANKAATVPPTK